MSILAIHSPQNNTPPCLKAALEFLARGWSVVPLCPPDHAGCSPQHVQHCTRPGKSPVISWGEYQRRLPREGEVRLWWTQNPACNVGVILGRVSKLVGLDIDGPEAWDLLMEISHGDVPATLQFRTPGGGLRLLYEFPEGADVRVPKRRFDRGRSHVIILGEGSLTVMPPSIHPSGLPYPNLEDFTHASENS